MRVEISITEGDEYFSLFLEEYFKPIENQCLSLIVGKKRFDGHFVGAPSGQIQESLIVKYDIG